jgi:hypothetical protein
MGHFLRPIARILGAIRLLVLGKPSSGIKPIVVGKVLYQLDNKALCFLFQDAFPFHLLLHKFGMVVRGKCEVVV